MRQLEVSRKLIVVAALALGLGNCFAEPDRAPAAAAGRPGTGGMADTGGAPNSEAGLGGATAAPACVARPAVKGAECKPVTSAEPLRARIVEDVPQETLYFTESLFGEFNSLCGSCHVASNLGGFGVNRTNFAEKVDEKARAAIRSNAAHCERDAAGNKLDADCFAFMPPQDSPVGKPWSERENDLNDPVTRLEKLLEVWIAAERPADAFKVPPILGGESPYAIDADFAETFTNLGTCIPDPGMVATELDESCALDARFAALEKKPDSNLPNEQLGLPSTLQETDLVTLDSAELARHGVVAYVPTYPLWTDDAGKLRHIRVPQGQSVTFNEETRQFDIPTNTRFYKTFLKKILDRDGVERFRKIETRVIVSRSGKDSLFGTYQWNEEETQAALVTDPLNNGKPFKDRLLSVVTDLAKADEIKAAWEAGKIRNYTKELDYAGVVRRYAIPGSERCIQCHVGGVGQSFVLGFTPLQLYSRECTASTLESVGHCDGGVIEPAIGDQVTQLERFISYGIVSGYDVASQLVSLEDPQGTPDAPRAYRSPEELVAQGYLLGNCAHCHNPGGYPSMLSPELKPLLNFRPGEEGGIFGFPLERYSPRVLRAQGAIQLPYITPSLRDMVGTSGKWTPKEQVVKQPGMAASSIELIDAPWRSLIYRNVDTPFVYADDAAIYPHMPLNSPGFDCRAPRIMGDWMVSIPALKKHPELTEDVLSSSSVPNPENDPQPYYEVKPGEPNYLNGVAQAQKRLAAFRGGLRYKDFCPETKDIVDVWDILYGSSQIPRDGQVKGLPKEGVPDRPHWVVTDLTDPPGEWNPRRTDWKTILVEQDFSASEQALEDLSGATRDFEVQRIASEKQTVQMLQGLGLSSALEKFVTTKLPFGLWQEKEGCDFGSVPKAAAFQGSQRPRWMTLAPPKEQAPVYEALPGAAVFGMICINCHGADADSGGRQATTLQEMTGGLGRVANFRDGFFGPAGSGGANRQRVFGSVELARRYLVWMALGGTRTQIPSPILDLVAGTPVLGAPRQPAPSVTTANMLETARSLCLAVATRGNTKTFVPAELTGISAAEDFADANGLMLRNGDAELWGSLCTLDNPSPIHAIVVEVTGSGPRLANYSFQLFGPAAYPADAPVGDVLGRVEASRSPTNDFPWCVAEPTDPALLAFLDTQRSSDGKPLPRCPAEVVAETNRWKTESDSTGRSHIPQLEAWGTRGAMNAGLAVFSYLDSMVSQGKGRALAFSECELIKTGAP